MELRFWGVRGSYPVPGKKTIRYGGNTSCIEILAADKHLVLDAGTGICHLGEDLVKRNSGRIKLHLFLTHMHWDHIQGFPFFKPSYLSGNKIMIYGLKDFDKNMEQQMAKPFFPLGLHQMGADIMFKALSKNDALLIGDITVKTNPGNHTDNSLIYRLDHQGKSCAYLVDYEHSDIIEGKIIDFINRVDLLIYDAHFTGEEYSGLNDQPSRRGWGHSIWQEGVRLAKRAKAKQLILTHHAPHRSDQQLEDIGKQAKEIFADCIIAREGLRIKL